MFVGDTIPANATSTLKEERMKPKITKLHEPSNMLNKSYFRIRWIIKVEDILCFEGGFEICKFRRWEMPVESSLRIILHHANSQIKLA